MKTHENPRPIWIPGLAPLALALVLLPAITPVLAVVPPLPPAVGAASVAPQPPPAARPASVAKTGTVRVYTNADLAKLEPVSAAPITNAKLKAPLPTQGAPIAETPSWDFVLEWIDRERAYEAQRREQELRSAAIALAAQPQQQSERYSFPGFPYYFSGVPIAVGSPPLPVPSNPMLPLRARGVRTAYDLYKESVRDARIRRDSLP